MSFEIHREPLFKRNYSAFLSGACLYSIVSGFLLIFLPLILAYNSSDFWIKESITYEQPSVNYKYVTTVELTGERAGNSMSLIYSTSPVINSLNVGTLRVATVQSAEQDDNRDGRTDRIELSVLMPLSSDEIVTGFAALVYCDVKLSAKARYLFDAAALVQHESGSGMSTLRVDGDLTLRQTWPLAAKGGYRSPYEGAPLLDLSRSNPSAHSVSVAAVLEKMGSRNLTMRFQPSYAYGALDSTARGASSGLLAPTRFFNASVVLRIPEQPVRYSPEISVVLKQAWIQYMAFFAVVAFLLFRLNSFVFGHQLLSTHTVADIVYEKMD